MGWIDDFKKKNL